MKSNILYTYDYLNDRKGFPRSHVARGNAYYTSKLYDNLIYFYTQPIYINYNNKKGKPMGRSRYKIYEPTHPHFITCTVLNWIPLFTRKESVEILIESFKYLQLTDNLKLYAYVILENHIHIVAQSDDINKSMAKFKRHTARKLIMLLQKENVKTILEQLIFYKKAHKSDRPYQLWQEGIQPKLIQSDSMMTSKINYIHHNPVKRGYIDEAAHWRYSSARDYEGTRGLLEVERLW